jgi:hypothetical protein
LAPDGSDGSAPVRSALMWAGIIGLLLIHVLASDLYLLFLTN